jgi:hypothetical protein
MMSLVRGRVVGKQYPQVLLQCLKSLPVLALHHAHSREASLTQIQCREMTECLNRLLCDDGVLLLERQPK